MEDELADIGSASIPNEEPTNPQSLVSTLVMSILAFLFSVGCCYFALFSVSFRHGLVSSAARHAAMESDCLKPIPARFLCRHRFPNRHHNESHAKWTAPVLFTLEAQYRGQGVADRLLQPNQYVLLSGDSFAEMAAAHHSTTVDNLSAHIGRRGQSALPVGAPENLRAYVPAKDPCRSVHPIAETSFKKPSPIEFEITSLSRHSGVEHIKRSLSTVGRPFPVSFRMPNRRFWIPVTDGGQVQCAGAR
jgi:hypothetical protein